MKPPAAIEIEHDIPVPPRVFSGPPSQYRQLAERVEVGDSCILNKAGANALANFLKKFGFGVTTRSVDGDRFRVWKLAPQEEEATNDRDATRRPHATAANRRADS